VETEIILFGVLLFLLFSVVAVFFTYYSFKIYNDSYTFNYFIKWIFSCFLLFCIYLIGEPSLSLESVLEIALVYFGIIFVLIVLFYLLRIEERGFEYKYIIGLFISFIIYLVSITCFVLSKSQISLYDSVYASIYILYILLIPVSIIYTLKIIYNKLIKNKRIRYPIIFFGLFISILLAGLIFSGIQKSLNLIYNLIIFILIFAFFI